MGGRRASPHCSGHRKRNIRVERAVADARKRMQRSGTKVKHTERLESLNAARHHAAECWSASMSGRFGGQGQDRWSRRLPRSKVSCERFGL